MRTLTGLIFVLLCLPLHAAERLSIDQVDSNVLTQETQKSDGADNAMDLVWWIPVEFWEAALSGNPAVTPQQVAEVVDTLRPYSVIAVVQADISNMGAFHFFDEKKVTDGLRVEYRPAEGPPVRISVNELAHPDVVLLLNQLSPILTAAMGNMGENFYFFPLPDTDKDGNRLVSPYEEGMLRVTLTKREGVRRPPFEFQLPLNSLHEPRLCPNGRPAHISWKYCPWSGSKLED